MKGFESSYVEPLFFQKEPTKEPTKRKVSPPARGGRRRYRGKHRLNFEVIYVHSTRRQGAAPGAHQRSVIWSGRIGRIDVPWLRLEPSPQEGGLLAPLGVQAAGCPLAGGFAYASGGASLTRAYCSTNSWHRQVRAP